MKKTIPLIITITITLFSSCITRPVVLTFKDSISDNDLYYDSSKGRIVSRLGQPAIDLDGKTPGLPAPPTGAHGIEDNKTSQKTFQPSTINIEYDTIPIESLLDSLNDIQQQVLRKLDTINRNNEKIKYLDSIGAFDTSGKYVKWFEGENIEATNSQDTIPKILIYIDTTLRGYDSLSYNAGLVNKPIEIRDYVLWWMNGYEIIEIKSGKETWSAEHKSYLNEDKQLIPKSIIVLMTK